MTLPPPKPTIKSGLNSRARSAASSIVPIGGSAWTSENTWVSKSVSFRISKHLSRRPSSSSIWSVTTNIRLPGSSDSSLSASSPKMTRLGRCRVHIRFFLLDFPRECSPFTLSSSLSHMEAAQSEALGKQECSSAVMRLLDDAYRQLTKKRETLERHHGLLSTYVRLMQKGFIVPIQ